MFIEYDAGHFCYDVSFLLSENHIFECTFHFFFFGKSALHCGNGESAKSGFKIVTQLTFHIHGFFRFQYVTFIARFLIGVAAYFWFYFPFLCE